MTLKVRRVLLGPAKQSFSRSRYRTEIWWKPDLASTLIQYKRPAPGAKFSMASSQRGMGNA
eukprot:scaffold5430_cov100-Amphora_coffeaeformis.AAC.1